MTDGGSNSINKLERPSYLSKITFGLCRKSLGVLHDTSKQKFTRLETDKPC